MNPILVAAKVKMDIKRLVAKAFWGEESSTQWSDGEAQVAKGVLEIPEIAVGLKLYCRLEDNLKTQILNLTDKEIEVLRKGGRLTVVDTNGERVK